MELTILRDRTIPKDEYINYLRNALKYEVILCKNKNNTPFQQTINLQLIRNDKVCQAAHMYIKDLIEHDYILGTLYFLNKQCLLNPLKLEFNAYSVVDFEFFSEIVTEIDTMAQTYFNPSDINFECTKIELLYFFILIINPHLNWITIDFLLQGNKLHPYIISSPNFENHEKSCIDIKSVVFENARNFMKHY